MGEASSSCTWVVLCCSKAACPGWGGLYDFVQGLPIITTIGIVVVIIIDTIVVMMMSWGQPLLSSSRCAR